jgi:hypothetical protein
MTSLPNGRWREAAEVRSACRCLLLSLFLLWNAAHAAAADEVPVRIEALRLGLSPENTRLVFDLDGPAPYTLRRMDNPARLVLELPAGELDAAVEIPDWQGSPVERLRAEAAGTALRLVFDLREPVSSRAFSLEPGGPHGHRIVLDLASLDAERRPVVRQIRSGRHGDFSRFVLDLDGPAGISMEDLPDQGKVAVQVQRAVIDPEILAVSLAGTPVEALLKEGDSRLVFSLSEPVRPRFFFLTPGNGKGYRAVLDLMPQTAGVEVAGIPPPPPVDGGAEFTAVDPGPTSEPGVAERKEPPSAGNPATASSAAPGITRRPPSAGDDGIAFSGTWEQEWAMADGDNQKFETLLQPRWDMDLFEGQADLTLIARLRIDTIGELGPAVQRPFNYGAANGPWFNDEHASFDLRELYVDLHPGEAFLRLGKQQVVWGQADGIKVLDVVNPQSFREFILDDFDDSRIPLWMVNLEVPVGRDGSLQLLWIPDTTYHELAEPGSPYAFTSPLLVPQPPPGFDVVLNEPEKPDDPLSDADFGGRYRTFIGGWDLSLNYLYQYGDLPVPFQRLASGAGAITAVLDPAYERSHLVGGTASTAIGDLILRTEVAWNSDSWFISADRVVGGVESTPDVSSVVGLDWQFASSGLFSTQWFYNRALDYQTSMFRKQTEQTVTLLLRQGFANDSWELRALALHSLDYHDELYQLKLKYWLAGNLEMWLAADIFSGDRDGLFGQFSEQDRVLLGLQYGF